MEKGLGLLISPPDISHRADPRLRFLVPWEPAYRVFFRNLFDLLLFRTVPHVEISSRPARFWGDVFVYSGVSWWALVESAFWHLLLLLLFVSVYPEWVAHHQPLQRKPLRRSSLTYYPPSFPAVGGARSRAQEQAQQRARANAAAGKRPSAFAVARERAQGNVSAPDLKTGRSRLPDLGGRPVLPSVPSAAIGSARLTVPPDLAAAVGPPPDLAGGASGRRGMAGPGGVAVAPPPMVAGSMRGAGGVALGHAPVVGPAPSVNIARQRTASSAGAGAGLGADGVPVVPPPPSVNRSGIVAQDGTGALGGGGIQVVPPPASLEGAGEGSSGGASPRARGNGLGSGGLEVVPPPPSIASGGGAAGDGRGHGLAGSGIQVVPPPPSLGNGSGGSGSGASSRQASLGNGGTAVVPPPPGITGGTGAGGTGRGGASGEGSLITEVVPPPVSVSGAGGSGGGGRGASLGNGGSQVVPPPPSVGGGGGNSAGGGRGSGTALGGSQVAGPPASSQVASNFGGGGGPAAANIPSHAAPPTPPQPTDAAHEPGQEMPVRLIGLAFFLPGSSYFSSYEVFIAERRLKKGDTQLIKLVYKFLPYQRRLSEYGLNASGVYKLMVRRDPSCDETLLQMSWHQTNQTAPEVLANTAGHTEALPCYTTSADDYRKALKPSR